VTQQQVASSPSAQPFRWTGWMWMEDAGWRMLDEGRGKTENEQCLTWQSAQQNLGCT